MRSRNYISFTCLTAAAIISLYTDPAMALLAGELHGRYSLIGKVKAQATIRTVDTPDNNPIPIEAGQLISQRNLLMLEAQHNLGNVWSGLGLAYYLQGRAYYDGVWDYGPGIFSSDQQRAEYLYFNRDQINDLKWDADLFLGYLDVTKGPFLLRVGRQVTSWGEMSTLRVLDCINPLDTSSLAVDLLERRVPLFMTQVNLSFADVGPFSTISIQGYYVPGSVDNTNGEDIIDGSPIYPPIGRDTQEDLKDPLSMASLKQNTIQVEDDIRSDRYGVKLELLIAGIDLNFAYCRTFSDRPVPLLDLSTLDPVYITPEYLRTFDPSNPIGWVLDYQKMEVLLDIDTVDVYGGSFNYHWGLIDTVLRGEVALYKNVPKMTPGSIRAMANGISQKIFLSCNNFNIPLSTIVPLIPSFGPFETKVLPFSIGNVATFDVLKYGAGFDKWMKIPHLNDEDFTLILEYVGSWIPDYKKNTILQPWYEPDGSVIYEPKYSNTFVFIANTNYLNGNLIPQLVAMYEVEPKALSLIPSARYQWRDFQFDASYFFTVSDNYSGTTGMLASRNEVMFSLTYNF